MTDSNVGKALAERIMAAIASTPVVSCLANHPAVALERLARGGGATRWYFIEDSAQLPLLTEMFRPGSTVSFYFDDRIAARPLDEEFVDLVLDLVKAHGEAVVGELSMDGLVLDVDFVAGLGDLTERLGATVDGTRLFVGAFPARDNDGFSAVTLELPDADGVVRCHPH